MISQLVECWDCGEMQTHRVCEDCWQLRLRKNPPDSGPADSDDRPSAGPATSERG